MLQVGPNEIYGVEKYEGSATTPGTNEGNIEELNRELHGKQYSSHGGEVISPSLLFYCYRHLKFAEFEFCFQPSLSLCYFRLSLNHWIAVLSAQNLPSFDGSGEGCKKYPWESSSFSLACAAIGFFTSIVTSLFGPLGSTSQSDSVSSGHIPEDVNGIGILLEKEVFEAKNICCEPHPSELQTRGKTNLIQEVEEDPEKEGFKAFTACENSEDQFRQFDMVSDSSDHHFLGASKGLALSQVRDIFHLSLQIYWLIPSNNLDNPFSFPLSIFFPTGEKSLGEEGSARMEHSREIPSWLVLLYFLYAASVYLFQYYSISISCNLQKLD